eukprot:TRINITY_DN334_c0_g1_i1.p1 TRINITY_DN334_c0_g1~~TRINITY_DN334_c0_g1_i1.p1  ORF type:complete len:333 (+),score=101.34 TRINITY_DN334_c0_g1_i1:55-1053(+)
MGGGSHRYSGYSSKSTSKASKSSYSSSSSSSAPSTYTAPAPSFHEAEAKSAASSVLSADQKDAMMSSFSMGEGTTGIDVCFSFDTTGSMYPCLQEVRDKLKEITTRLLKEIPNIRIAILAHGDYCDFKEYVTKYIDFTTDSQALCHFAETVSKTGGGDLPEAYELALQDANKLSWDQTHSKALVMIGDEVPHAPSYTTEKIFWKNEVKQLKEKGVVIYGVQALNVSRANPFYSEVSTLTGGYHLRLTNFALITEMFVAVCFRATSSEKYEEYKQNVEKDGKMNTQVQAMLTSMDKPTEKQEFDIKTDWWDPKYDHGKPSYKYCHQTQKWSHC